MKKTLAMLLAAALCAGLLAGCGAEPAAEEAEQAETAVETTTELETIVFTEQVRGYHWAPAYLAQTLGYYEEEGLTAEFQTVSGMDATAPVISGDAQFCLKGVESALMVNEAGQNCKIVVSTTQKYPYQLIGASEEYSTIESLRGGVMAGGQSANSGPYSFAMACANAAGMVPEQDVSIITMASSGYAAAIASGEIQAAVGSNPWASKKLVDAGGVVIADGTDDAVIEQLIGSASYELFAVITSQDYIDNNSETVQKTVNAITKAIAWMEQASPEEIAAQLLPLFDGAEEELLYDAQYDKEHGVATTTGYHSESGFAAAVQLTQMAGGITGTPTAEDTYDESFLDAAWNG